MAGGIEAQDGDCKLKGATSLLTRAATDCRTVTHDYNSIGPDLWREELRQFPQQSSLLPLQA